MTRMDIVYHYLSHQIIWFDFENNYVILRKIFFCLLRVNIVTFWIKKRELRLYLLRFIEDRKDTLRLKKEG
jgi:hypothetical protein